MKFIILLCCLLLQRETRKPDYKRSNEWFRKLLESFETEQGSFKKQLGIYAFCVLLPALVLAFLLSLMSGVLWGTVAFVTQVLLFLYVLGRDDTEGRFGQYLRCWQHKDYQGAYLCAKESLNIDLTSVDPQSLHEQIAQSIISEWFSRWFVVVFWFVVGGVPLSFVALLSYWFVKKYKWLWCESLIFAIEWLPSRLLAFTASLVSGITGRMASSFGAFLDFNTSPTQLLVSILVPTEGGFNAEKAQAQLLSINQVMMRCVVLWLLIVAVLTLFGVLR